jgi:hypothetical protein
MEAISNSIKCTQCKQVLNSPVILPCGHAICQGHVESNTRENLCKICNIVHAVPKNGFTKIKALEDQLKANIDKVKFSSKYEGALSSCRDFEKRFLDFTSFNENPNVYVQKTIGELKIQTQSTREDLKRQVDQIANEIIRELDEYEHECLSHLNLNPKVKETSDYLHRMSEQLDFWKKSLAKFNSNTNEWNLIKKANERETVTLGVKLNDLKEHLLLQKLDTYKLRSSEFKKIQTHLNLE